MKLDIKGSKCFLFVIYLICSLLCGIGTWFVFGGVDSTLMPFILVLAPPFYFFLKKIIQFENVEKKSERNICFIFSAFMTLILFLGKGIVNSAGIYKSDYKKVSLLAIPGLFILLSALFRFLMHYLMMKNLTIQDNKRPVPFFFFCWICIFILWLPYLLTQLPAVMDFDSMKQIDMIRGLRPLTNHHPVLHTLLIDFCLKIGGGSPTAYAIVQMLIMSFIFSYAIIWVYSKGVSSKICLFILAYFALNPLHASYSVTMGKDVLFSGFVLLFTIVLCQAVLTKGESISRCNWIVLAICSILGIMLFRNNGPIVLIILAVVLLIVFRKFWKQWLTIFTFTFLVFFVIQGPIFTLVGVEQTHFTESLGIPLQQVARVVAMNGNIDEEQLKVVDDFVSVDTIKKNYNPYCVDFIKSEVYGADFHHDVLEKRKSDFFKLWFQLFLKNPKMYIESYLDSTYGYWYPLSKSYVSTWHQIHPNRHGYKAIEVFPNFSKILGVFADTGWKCNIPSLCIFTVIFFAAIAWLKKGSKYFIPFLPVILLWLTILVASPIATSLRYLYHAFVAIPVLIIFTLLPSQDK